MDRERALRRCRSLLAKADSTTFPAERESLLAKRCELMERHGLAEADFEVSEPVPVAAFAPTSTYIVVYGNRFTSSSTVSSIRITFA